MINMQRTINKIIISNIKKYRYKNNLSQNKLEELSGLEINKIENNKKIISTKELLILSNIFKININSLFKIESIEHTIISINEHIQNKNLKDNSLFIKNLFMIYNDKIKSLNERITIISKKTIRNKLLEFFNLHFKKNNSRNIYIPFSYQSFADYLCIDRTAMSRELKNLKDEGFIKITGKRITLLYK